MWCSTRSWSPPTRPARSWTRRIVSKFANLSEPSFTVPAVLWTCRATDFVLLCGLRRATDLSEPPFVVPRGSSVVWKRLAPLPQWSASCGMFSVSLTQRCAERLLGKLVGHVTRKKGACNWATGFRGVSGRGRFRRRNSGRVSPWAHGGLDCPGVCLHFFRSSAQVAFRILEPLDVDLLRLGRPFRTSDAGARAPVGDGGSKVLGSLHLWLRVEALTPPMSSGARQRNLNRIRFSTRVAKSPLRRNFSKRVVFNVTDF